MPDIDAYLRFDHPNVGYILDGLEDATVRYDFDRDLATDDLVRLLTPNGMAFAVAIVVDVWTAPLRLAHHDMTVADGRNHPSDGALDLFHRLREHYPDADLDGDTEVTVISFDIVRFGDVDD